MIDHSSCVLNDIVVLLLDELLHHVFYFVHTLEVGLREGLCRGNLHIEHLFLAG